MNRIYFFIFLFLTLLNISFSSPEELNNVLKDNELKMDVCLDINTCGTNDLVIGFHENLQVEDGGVIFDFGKTFFLSGEFENISSLNLNSLEGIDINTLFLITNTKIVSLNFINTLPNLEYIQLITPNVIEEVNLDMEKFTSLKRILEGEEYFNLTRDFYTKANNFEVIVIDDNLDIENFNFLENSKVKTLNIEGYSSILSLEGLDNLKNLKELKIETIDEITFSALVNFEEGRSYISEIANNIPSLRKVDLGPMFLLGGSLNKWEGCQEIANGNLEYSVEPEFLCDKENSIEKNDSIKENTSLNSKKETDIEERIENISEISIEDSLINSQIQKKSSSYLIPILLFCGVGIIIIVFTVVIKSKRNKEYRVVSNYIDTYRNSYTQEQIRRGLLNAKINEKTINKVFLEKFN